MPQITKLRIVNFQYPDVDRLIADELFDFENEDKEPSDVLINLENGGGKSVLVQLMLQPVIPRAKVAGRKIESFFTRTSDHCFVALEWALEGSKMRLMTGIALSAGDAARNPDEDRGFRIKYYTFLSSYQDYQGRYDIISLPLSRRERNHFIPASYEDVRNLAKKSGGNLERYASEDSARWKDRLAQYGIMQNEWKLIEELNSGEDGLTKYFSDLKSSDAVIDRLILPRIEERQGRSASAEDSSLETMLISYARQFSRQQEIIKERGICQGFLEMLQVAQTQTEQLWNDNNRLELSVGDIFAYADALGKRQASQEAETGRLAQTAEDLEKEYSGSAAALAEQQKSFHEGSARYKTLRNITERYEGYSGSIRRVMENKDREKGLIGLVSDIIKVDRDYETAIETALGGSISNIVTEDEDTARRMIEFLKKNRYGRATFLPLTSIRGRKAQASEGVRGEAGFIGMGDELVKTDDRYKNIASFLLGRIYIVDNMDHALAIARNYRYSFRIVTLGGESLNPGGSISGGAYKKTGNLLARHREMDELKAHVDQLSGRIRELAKGLEELDGRRQKMARERQKIRSDHEQLLLGRNTVQMQLSQLEGRNAESEKTIADIEKELARMESDKKERGDILAAIDGQIDDLARQKEETSGRSGQAGQELKKLSQREEELSARNTELKIRYSKLRQRLDFTKENIERNENEKKALAEEIENINSQMDQTRNRSLQLEEEEKELLAQIQDCQRSISRGDEALKQALGERDRCKQEHGSFFDRREEISQTLASLDREQVRLTTQKEKIDERRSSLSDHMWDEYKLTYVGAGELRSEQVQNLPLGRIKKLVEDTRRSMRDLGDVNVASIDQYEAVSGRYETMKAQLDDLTAARAKLNGIIDSLNASMKKQFAEKFALIGEKFDQVFSSLFGGGKGTLSLTDPDDLLGSGIIITAQPPGKKLQNMMQLSGGEKALTAIALLFAIQYLKPSPFCLLDEIEAALDDANVKRFAEYLGNLTKDTQFIVITHRRGTMKAADVLYGITMQEKGVSAMVSVNLIENQLSR